jgi:CMP-N,N'-diacetyllegionaminic acid synthase
MKILALITARGGSKRLPGKNIRILGGKPLINWTIDVVKGLPSICCVLVSTDNSEIASICKKAGANVPWLRPPELATDEASSADVALHALDWYESENGNVDGLILLQPTSPFRSRETLEAGIKLFVEKKRSVIAVSEVKAHPSRCFSISSGNIRMFCESEACQRAYAANGSLYIISPSALRQTKSFLEETSIPLIIDSPRESIDIDTDLDWFFAESLLKL